LSDYVNVVLILVVGLAALIDLKTRKIPNWLTLTVAAAGIIGGFLFFGLQGNWSGGWHWLQFSGLGWLVGIGIFLIPFVFGGIGGGDVKLMGAIGALKGVSFVIEAAILIVLWGGLMAVLAILYKRKTFILKRFGMGLKWFAMTRGKVGKDLLLPEENANEKEKVYVPYGVAIFLGVITAYLVELKIPL